MKTIDMLINAIESYGDRERNYGKAIGRGDSEAELRWDKEADKELAVVRNMLEQVISE